MANALVRDPVDWINGRTIGATELAALDAGLTAAVNGDGGGTYEQGAGGTTIGGAGVWLASSTAHAISGATARVLTPSGKLMVHADSDYTTLSPSHLGGFRVLLTACARATTTSGDWVVDPYARNALQSTRLGAEMVVPLRVVDGARIGYANLSFYVMAAHANVPASPIRCRLLRVDASGNATPLTTNDAGGFVSFTDMAAVGSGGGLQTLTVFCDTANIVDSSAYSYVAHVIEEAGQDGVAGNLFADIAIAHYDIADLRPE